MAQQFDKQTGDQSNELSLNEIAAAFGDGELAEDPLGVWDEDAHKDEKWTADFSQMTVFECDALVTSKRKSSHHSKLKHDGVTDEEEIHLPSPAADMTGLNSGRGTIPLLSTPTLKSASFQLQDPHYINQLGMRVICSFQQSHFICHALASQNSEY